MLTKSVACPQYCSALPVIRCTLPVWDSDGLPITYCAHMHSEPPARPRPRRVFRCRMFLGAAAFNQNIGGWNTAKVSDMYSGCHDCMCKLVDFGNLQGSNNRLLARRGATKCLREDRVGRQHGE